MAHRMARPSWSHGGGWCTCHWGEGPTLWLMIMRVYDMGYDSPQSLMKFRIWPGFSYYFVAEKQMLKPVTIHHPCIFRRVCPVKIDCHSARSISIRLGATFLVMACAFKFRPTFFHTMFFTNEILQLFEVWTAWSWIKLSPTSRALRPLETFDKSFPDGIFGWLVRWSLTFCWPSTGSNAGSKLIPMFSSLTSWKLFQHL